MSKGKIIFAALARDVEPFLAGVTKNIENFAAAFDAWAVLVAENDSRDGTRGALKSWMEKTKQLGAVQARLFEMDGLETRHPVRTDRIAAARNHILEAIEADPVLRDFDYLAVLDTDFPNSQPLPPENFARAISFLQSHGDAAGVFANSLPLYYDIWALREKSWCPDDCWDEVAAAPDQQAATAEFIHARQIFIDPSRAPIEVDSAFGGFGIYRLKSILGRRYEGLRPDGGAVCEHVGMHAGMRRDGGRLFILPDLTNLASFEHTDLAADHGMVAVAGRASLLLASDAVLRNRHSPGSCGAFARLAMARKGGAILDLAPQGGLALIHARLADCQAPYICAEDKERHFAVLSANAQMQRKLFGDHQLVRASPAEAISRHAKDAGLVRLGTSNDAALLKSSMADLAHQPLLFARFEGPDEAPAWEEVLDLLPHEYVIAINAPGAMIASGPLAEQKARLSALFQKLPRSGGGLDLIFFPHGAEQLFLEFKG